MRNSPEGARSVGGPTTWVVKMSENLGVGATGRRAISLGEGIDVLGDGILG